MNEINAAEQPDLDKEIETKSQTLYFHGTSRENLESLLQKGLATRHGRATLATSALYAFKYATGGGFEEKIDDGVMAIFVDAGDVIKPAKDSFIIFDEEQKVIGGWPNRYKTNAYGYFPKKEEEQVNLGKENLVGVLAFNEFFVNKLREIETSIKSGVINNEKINQYVSELKDILSDEDLNVEKPKLSAKDVAGSIVIGLIRYTITAQMRQSELSFYAASGWKVENLGDHEVKLKTKDEAETTINNLRKIIDQDFISGDIRQEFHSKFPL